MLMLEQQAALHLALVLHELATNARKHGALSVPSGRLAVTWTVQTNGQQNLLLSWKESDGPKVRAPNARGFGSTLIEHTLRALGGQTSVHYGMDGLTCEIKLPLPKGGRSSIGGYPGQPRVASMAAVLPPQESQLGKLEGKRILVIEDEPLVAMDLESTLTSAGCEVVGPAGTIEEAKSLVADGHYDAAL